MLILIDGLKLLPAILAGAGGFLYINAIVRSGVRPNVGTWVIWNIVTALTAYGMWQAGTINSLITTSLVVNIFILYFVLRKCQCEWSLLDFSCLGISAIGILAFLFSSDPLIAIVAGLVAAVVASIPTIHKVIKDPGSEPAGPFIIFSGSCAASIAIMPEWSLTHSLQPVVWLLNGIVILGCIYVGKTGQREVRVRA